jgi:DNA polymerase
VPFSGPAGRVLADALEQAGLAGVRRYVTNVVKHFKHEPRGKRRIHKRPNQAEAMACRYWLDQEFGFVKPKVVVALGSTAAQMLLGRPVRVLAERGGWADSGFGTRVLITVHPSSILRAPDSASRSEAMRAFVADLRIAARAVGAARKKPPGQP